MSLRLEQYGMIGDCQTAALVGANGSIDWLCFPSFDSPACFAALLGDSTNGRWLLAPADPDARLTRSYRGDTLILESHYETSEGAVTVVDCMRPRTDEPDLIRLVIGKRGKVPMRMELAIRFDYGSIVPWVRRAKRGIRAVAGPDTLILETPVELQGHDLTTIADFQVSAGEEVPFVLMWYPSHKPAPASLSVQGAIRQTERWWQDWLEKCTYDGPWRDAVIRSLVTLKALTYAPTGGIVAAPTTSLPEKIGGVRNWDYRYCWIRDATFTLYSLINTGYTTEAREFRDWLLRAVAGDPGALHIVYSVFGGRRLTELELPCPSPRDQSREIPSGGSCCGTKAAKNAEVESEVSVVYGFDCVQTKEAPRPAESADRDKNWSEPPTTVERQVWHRDLLFAQ